LNDFRSAASQFDLRFNAFLSKEINENLPFIFFVTCA